MLLRIFLTVTLNVAVQYSQSLSFQSWIHFLMVLYMSFFRFCFIYSRMKIINHLTRIF